MLVSKQGLQLGFPLGSLDLLGEVKALLMVDFVVVVVGVPVRDVAVDYLHFRLAYVRTVWVPVWSQMRNRFVGPKVEGGVLTFAVVSWRLGVVRRQLLACACLSLLPLLVIPNHHVLAVFVSVME